MTVLRAAGLVVCWGAAAMWSVRAIRWIRGMRRLPDLLDLPLQQPAGRVSVIVPARNEEASIDSSLRSLLASKNVDLTVIAVDDRSTDRTGAIMDALTQETLGETIRYRVEHVRDLPQGWLGKPHAMARGAEGSAGEWLLFTDADVIFREDALARALHYLEAEGADHLLVVPTVVAASAGESMMLAFLHVLSIWGPQLWRVADPDARDSVGVGAFNLMRRSAYEQLGGWERLRMEVIEDLRMGYLIKRGGFMSRVVTGRNLIRIRWANGAWGVVTNLTKNVFAAFRFRLDFIIAGMAGVALLCLSPFAALAVGLAGDHVWLAPAGVALGALLALYWNYRHHADPGGASVLLWAACFPFGALLFLFAMGRSTLLTLARGGVMWRGTFYPLLELRAHAGPLQ